MYECECECACEYLQLCTFEYLWQRCRCCSRCRRCWCCFCCRHVIKYFLFLFSVLCCSFVSGDLLPSSVYVAIVFFFFSLFLLRVSFFWQPKLRISVQARAVLQVSWTPLSVSLFIKIYLNPFWVLCADYNKLLRVFHAEYFLLLEISFILFLYLFKV